MNDLLTTVAIGVLIGIGALCVATRLVLLVLLVLEHRREDQRRRHVVDSQEEAFRDGEPVDVVAKDAFEFEMILEAT